jgi:hypothetical protein
MREYVFIPKKLPMWMCRLALVRDIAAGRGASSQSGLIRPTDSSGLQGESQAYRDLRPQGTGNGCANHDDARFFGDVMALAQKNASRIHCTEN